MSEDSNVDPKAGAIQALGNSVRALKETLGALDLLGAYHPSLGWVRHQAQQIQANISMLEHVAKELGK